MSEASPETPEARVMPIIMGLLASSAVSALARLGIPDQLESGPKSANELAAATGVEPDLLRRLMRATESLGILARTTDGRWQQTPMSDTLRAKPEGSLKDLAVFMADEWHVRGFGSLDETIRTGEQAIERIYGMPTFEFFRTHPEAGENFNRAMAGFSTMDVPAVLDAYDFSGIESITDVGGGHGLLVNSILERYPSMMGTLYELPQVIPGAREHVRPSVRDRLELAEGNMFESVPPGADAYIMKRIVHDWSDEMGEKLLSNCRSGVADDGRLIVVDAVVPAGGEFSPSKLMDLAMMLFVGGKERTEHEFRTLFESAGWKLARIVPTASQLSIIEGTPA